MQTFTMGLTPVAVIEAALDANGFSWQLQGSDSRTLEAACEGLKQAYLSGGQVSTADMLIILDKLLEYGESYDSEKADTISEYMADHALSLRSAVLESIGIEEV
jgi:hypothetical protein